MLSLGLLNLLVLAFAFVLVELALDVHVGAVGLDGFPTHVLFVYVGLV